MNKKILLPFAFSTLAVLMHGCGGESAKINEDPTKGVTVTKNASCDVTADDCLQFALDYPVAGLNFDCSGDKLNHFATKLDSNIVTGACKLGDEVSFYIQGESSTRKISLGTVKLDNISKIKLATPPRIRLIDMATALTNKSAASLNQNDETVRTTMALVKILQSIGLESGDNVIGDIQPTELTIEKKDKLAEISKDIGASEILSGQYVEVLKPWVDVTQISNDQAFLMVTQLLNLTNTGVWQADLPIFKAGSTTASSTTTDAVRPDGFFGCNKADCIKADSSLLHSMGRFFLLSDRQGYTLGYGQQWRGKPLIENELVAPPVVLISKVKPFRIQVNAQNTWLNPISREVEGNRPLRLSLNVNSAEDLLIKQGKLLNGAVVVGTEALYKQTLKLKENEVVDKKYLGLWEQNIDGTAYNGTIDIIKANPSSYLAKDIFRTEANVKSGQNYIFPLYATLTFKFSDATVTPKEVNIGIMIDQYGDIRTDIKKDATATDMSGNCGKTKNINDNGTITDEYGEIQYRIGTTGATLFSTNDKSITVRMILSNPKFAMVDGAMFGLNIGADYSGAKINIHNLLAGQTTGINLTDFSNNTVGWSNDYASYQLVYNTTYDKLEDKSGYVEPTAEERELAKRYSGTVSIKIADQNIPACKAIRTKS